ncbi:MAG: hypothetical protein Hals2KO_20080 [Halioglobus sp.]
MLSLSVASSNTDLDLQVINGQGDGGVALGAELRQFAEALVSRDEVRLADARKTLLQAAGPEILVDAAAVAANFQRMVRIADATGIPVDGLMDALSGSIQDELGLRRFRSADNSPPRSPFHALKSWLVRSIARRTLLRSAGSAKRQPDSNQH